MLRDINLTIPRGQTLVIIGESGCGKTVLLKSLIGLVRPTQGEVLFDGQNLAKLTERELARQRIRFGFVFQGAALFDSMTVAQNVAFPLRQHTDKTTREIRETVLDRLAEVGLPENILYKKPAELSGGMRKRVGLARALVLSPEVILYDEPTTGLDPIMSDVINELILRTRNRTPGDQRRGDARHAYRGEGGRSGRHALSAIATERGRIADHFRRPAGRTRAIRRSAGQAVRPRRSGRTADGNGRTIGRRQWTDLMRKRNN